MRHPLIVAAVFGLLSTAYQLPAANAQIQSINDQGGVCPHHGCAPNTLMPVRMGSLTPLFIDGPWVDWSRVTVETVNGSGTVSVAIISQTSPSLGQGKMTLYITPAANATGIRNIRLQKRANELNPLVPANIGTIRVQIVRNGRIESISPSRVEGGTSNVTHVITGTNIGNAVLHPISPSTAAAQTVSNSNTRLEIRASYPSRTFSLAHQYRVRENVGPFNGHWWNWYSGVNSVFIVANQQPTGTITAPAPAPLRPVAPRPRVTAPAPAPLAPDLEPLLNVPLLLRHIAPNRKLHATHCTGIPTGSTFSMQMITVPDVRWGITNTGDGDATGTFRAELRAGNNVLQSHTVNGLAAGEIRWFSYQRPQSTTQVGRVPMNPTQTYRAQYVATGNECVQVIPQRQQIHEWVDPPLQVRVDPAGVVANDSNPSNNARTF